MSKREADVIESFQEALSPEGVNLERGLETGLIADQALLEVHGDPVTRS